MQNKIDVLNLEFRSFQSRDTEKAVLVCNYLRMQGVSVVEGCVFNGYYLLLKYRPKILLMAGIIGADVNVAVARFAKWLGCKVVSLTAEGGYCPSWTAEQLLGWLPREEYFLDSWLQWSQSDSDILRTVVPELNNSVVVAGSVGHDRYFLPGVAKSLPIDKKYKMVVGIGGFVWDITCPFGFTGNWDIIKKFFWHERDLFAQILRVIIEKNPHIFFILKEHPGSQSLVDSGMELCSNFSNVLITKNAPIIDCIAASDIWLSVESNTSLEAWLLHKPTAIINPSGTTWPVDRFDFHLLQPNYPDVETIQFAIDQWLATGELPGFSDMELGRQNFIKKIIEHGDGLNHVRAGNIILNLLDVSSSVFPSSTWKDHAKLCCNNFLHWNFSRFHYLMPKFIPYFKQFELFWHDRSQWNQNEREHLSNQRQHQQEQFYEESRLSLAALRSLV